MLYIIHLHNTRETLLTRTRKHVQLVQTNPLLQFKICIYWHVINSSWKAILWQSWQSFLDPVTFQPRATVIMASLRDITVMYALQCYAVSGPSSSQHARDMRQVPSLHWLQITCSPSKQASRKNTDLRQRVPFLGMLSFYWTYSVPWLSVHNISSFKRQVWEVYLSAFIWARWLYQGYPDRAFVLKPIYIYCTYGSYWVSELDFPLLSSIFRSITAGETDTLLVPIWGIEPGALGVTSEQFNDSATLLSFVGLSAICYIQHDLIKVTWPRTQD